MGALHPLSLMWPVQGHGWAGQAEGDRAIWALTGQQQIKVKTVKPPAKVQIPRGEEQEEEEPSAGGREMGGSGMRGLGGRAWLCGFAQGLSPISSSAVPSPPPARVVKKPLTPGGAKAVQKAEAELTQKAEPDGGPRQAQGRDAVPSSEPPKLPSREIRNIIRMYQSRPGPVPVPVQPSRWARGLPALPTPQGETCRLLTFSFSQEAPPKFPEEKQP